MDFNTNIVLQLDSPGIARHRLLRPADWTRRTVLFFVLFQGTHLALFGYGWYAQQTNRNLAALNELEYSVWLSRGAALALSLDACLLLFSMCRESINFLRPRMRWFPMRESRWFHQQVAYSLLFYTCIHAGSHYVNFFNVQKLMLRPLNAVQIHYTQPGGITGHIMLLCLLLIFTTSHAKIRRQSFEVFWNLHHLFIVFYLALLCHGTGCFVRDSSRAYSPFAGRVFWEHCIGYQSFRWELFPVSVYIAERIYRSYRSWQGAKVLAIYRHPPKLLEIRFEKEGMNYKSGQWLFVKFPDIMADQWHPFTITSCPEDPYISVHIQQVGDFTGTFADAFDTKKEHYQLTPIESTDAQELRLKRGQTFPRIRIDGPYGSLAEDIFANEVSITVGAGIGITPWASILKSIWHLRNTPLETSKPRLRRLEFIWVCKDILHYRWLHEHIMALEAQSKTQDGQHRWPIVCSRIFITRQLDPTRLEHVRFRAADHRNSHSDPQDESLTDSTYSEISGASSETIPGVQFQASMNHGRPNFGHELGALTQELIEGGYGISKGGRRIIKAGVYYCGPDGPGKAVRGACAKASGETIEYRYWKERG